MTIAAHNSAVGCHNVSMNRMILTTVGVSTLTNDGWKPDQKRPELAWLVNKLKENPKEASAELRVLELLEIQPGDEVSLLHTATAEGELAAKALQAYLKAKDVVCECVKIGALAGTAGAMRNGGLRALAEEILERAETARKRGLEPVLNFNGGYKTQTATAMAVAAAEGVPCYYSHETFGELVEIPTLPLTWDRKFFSAAEPVLDLLLDPVEQCEFEAALETLQPELQNRVRRIAVSEDGLVMLSPLVWSAYGRHRKAEQQTALMPVKLSARAAKELKDSGSSRKRFDALIRKAAMKDGSTEWETKNACPDLLFGPKGRVDEHIAFSKAHGTVTIAAMWTSNTGYKDEIDGKAGLSARDHPGEEDWRPSPDA